MKQAVLRRDATVLLLTLLLAALVCFPMLGGPVLQLDWVQGGHTPVVSRSMLGLDGGQLAGTAVLFVVSALSRVIGDAVTWLPYALFFPIAGAGAARLCAGSTTARAGAALLFICNPFVFERMVAGQMSLLLGAALLPWLARIVLDSAPWTLARSARLAVLWAVMVAASIHFVWIVAVLLVATMVLTRRVRGLAIALVMTGVASTYLAVGPLGNVPAVTVTHADLVAYRSDGHTWLGTLGNVLSLYGFWRRVPGLPKDAMPVWPIVLALILVVAAIGIGAALRDAQRRTPALVLLGSGAAGALLAIGDQGPTGWVYRIAFDHLPAFDVMREPQKFAVLLLLLYAVGFGWGIGVLRQRASEVSSTAVVGVALALPILYSPTLVNGLNGHVKAVHVPASYAAAQRAMKAQPGTALMLPWHQYLGFPWSTAAIVNPAPRLFGNDVIVPDDVELPGLRSSSTSRRSEFIESLLAKGSSQTDFGVQAAHLGVRWVVLLRTVDYAKYSWLTSQTDLHVVLDTPEIELLRNDAALPSGARKLSSTSYLVQAGAQVEVAEPWNPSWSGAHITQSPWGTILVDSPSKSVRLTYPHAGVVRLTVIVDVLVLLALVALSLRRRDG